MTWGRVFGCIAYTRPPCGSAFAVEGGPGVRHFARGQRAGALVLESRLSRARAVLTPRAGRLGVARHVPVTLADTRRRELDQAILLGIAEHVDRIAARLDDGDLLLEQLSP